MKNKAREEQKKYEKEYKLKYPWLQPYYNLRSRCNNKNLDSYRRYGGRGIKALITRDEIKSLWFRDKAYEMEKATIDRIDRDKNYELSNCRFIELSENLSRDIRKPVIMKDLDGNTLGFFKSMTEAGKVIKRKAGNIGLCCNGYRNHCGGYKWDFDIKPITYSEVGE